MYYKVLVTSTGKTPRSSDDLFAMISQYTREFADLQQVKDYLEATYDQKCRSHRRKIFQDTSSGNYDHIGYIYRFREKDWSHSPVQEWIQEDWVTITKVEEVIIVL